MFFLNAVATFKASLFFSILGNIARVKKSGKVQKAKPKITIKIPLIANINRELPIKNTLINILLTNKDFS